MNMCPLNRRSSAVAGGYRNGLLQLNHRIRIHRRATRVGAFEVFEAAHVALRTLLAFSQPVNCIFWPIGMLNWLVAASKLHKHRVTCCTAEWPFYSFLILWLNYVYTPEQFRIEVSGVKESLEIFD